MKLLFITRKYPPMVGGMEKVSYGLIKELSKKVEIVTLTWGGKQCHLPIIIPLFLLKSLFIIPTKNITHIHLGDALLSPLGYFLKRVHKVKVSVTAHGLDITFRFPFYQYLVKKSLKNLDSIICVSNAAKIECEKLGIPKNLLKVIPNGVFPGEFASSHMKEDLENMIGETLRDRKIIITVGRLVKRKGVYWFIKNVFPKLDKNFIYLVVGDGPEKSIIEKLLDFLHLNDRVNLLGKVSDKQLKIIYNTADVMVLPNRHIEGNIEGFGIVAIEASSAGLPVIASKVDGLTDSVVDGKNGYLVNPKADEFIKILNRRINLNKSSVKKFTEENYSWQKISAKYLQTIQ